MAIMIPTARFRGALAFLLFFLVPCLPAAGGSVELAAGFTESGVASYYHDRFQGRTTASGERFDQRAYSAAHRTLPFGTMVRVTRVDTGKSVVVTVNDRGPFKKGRVVDLSRQAARDLDMVEKGLTRVKVEVLHQPTHRS
jgi:rare lipoprotein A